MAVNDIKPIASAIPQTLTTSVVALFTVPSNEEWVVRFLRGVCLLTTGTAPTMSIGISTSANELCFNEVVPIASALAKGAKNVLGPDVVHLGPGNIIYGRASAANAVRVSLAGTRKVIA